MSAHEKLTQDEALSVATGVGLNAKELAHIEKSLGRLPTRTEISVFAGMWSEHCAYKSTKPWLMTLPKDGAHILAGPGSHAGVVDVGEGWGVAFKIESHNHPSAVDPYQGATTGVGGILRDIVAQGARPCAVMDSLCFGSPDSARGKHLAQGIVRGIAGYGNAFGVPNIGGKTIYDTRYEGNPLVNALAAGLVRHDGMRTANAVGVGNKVLYVGAATGRDGILGAAFASEDLAEDNVESRPHVQVGDPFAGKKLMEACLAYTEAMGMVACQDMGASGITCGTMEMAAAGNIGMDIDLDQVPLREAGMTPQEILLSESQERFLFVIRAGTEDVALKHFRGYGVHAAIIGQVAEGEHVRVRHRSTVYVDLPASLVAGGAPLSAWPLASALPEPTPYPAFAMEPIADTLCAMLGAPGIADLAPLYNHYDQTVGNRTVRGPGQAAAAVMKLPNSKRGFALTISGRGEVCAADPYLGAQAALADALRDLACVGAQMCAITDGLNMASPRDPVENLKIKEVVRGLGDGLRALGVPVTGGNVSLYNESPAGPIPPSPMVGGLGTIDDVRQTPTLGLRTGDALVLLGTPQETTCFSHFARRQTGLDTGAKPHVDLAADKLLAAFIVGRVRAGAVRCAKGVGTGGVAVTLAKLCLAGNTGVNVTLPRKYDRTDWALFGEHAAMAWISCAPEHADALCTAARASGVPAHRVGTVGGESFAVADVCAVPMSRLQRAYNPGGVQ